MSHSFTLARIAAVIAVLVVIVVTAWSCGPSGAGSGDWSGNEEWNRAVGAFISGDYGDAVARLEGLEGKAETEEQLQEVYWYLGRCYLATNQYHRAIDAFAAGKAHGGGVVFDEYLRELDALVSGDPDNVVRSEKITRVQLAVLIERMFFGGPGGASEQSPETVGGAVSEKLTSVERGVMIRLPDGQFHPDAYVTRAVFYVTVSRLILEKGIDVDMGVLFEGGFAWVLSDDEDDGTLVTGKEVVAALRRVAAAQNTYGGQGS
jgi:hypothetical protein